MNILHLTHTDIESDSRILKEMNCIADENVSYKVMGIGVTLKEELHKTKADQKLKIDSIVLRSRGWKFLPTLLRHSCSLMELTTKMIFKALKRKPQVVHCNDTLVLPLGILLKWLTGCKVIYDAHELESDRNGISKTLGKMTLFVEKALWRWVDALIVVSPSIEKWYKAKVGEKYSQVIMNAPVLKEDIATFDREYLRNRFQIPKESKIFLYIGILGRGRGIELMLEAFKQKDITSHLIFLGYGDMENSLQTIAKEYDNIHLHPAVPHEEVVAVAKSADVGMCLIENVSLSDYYCLPNKMFEYCFAGVPILASNFPDISDVVDRYNLGKYCDLSVESIHDTVKEIEREDSLPKVDPKKLYDLSWAAQEEKLRELYKYVIKLKEGEK